MIEIKDVQLKLGQFVLKDIDVKIELGEYFVILGPSGSGKTVLLETIAGLYVPDEGKYIMLVRILLIFRLKEGI